MVAGLVLFISGAVCGVFALRLKKAQKTDSWVFIVTVFMCGFLGGIGGLLSLAGLAARAVGG